MFLPSFFGLHTLTFTYPLRLTCLLISHRAPYHVPHNSTLMCSPATTPFSFPTLPTTPPFCAHQLPRPPLIPHYPHNSTLMCSPATTPSSFPTLPTTLPLYVLTSYHALLLFPTIPTIPLFCAHQLPRPYHFPLFPQLCPSVLTSYHALLISHSSHNSTLMCSPATPPSSYSPLSPQFHSSVLIYIQCAPHFTLSTLLATSSLSDPEDPGDVLRTSGADGQVGCVSVVGFGGRQ